VGTDSLDAGSGDCSGVGTWQVCRSRDHRGAAGVNAALGFFQEGRAQATLAALKSQLALTASVRRDGDWKSLPADELVPATL